MEEERKQLGDQKLKEFSAASYQRLNIAVLKNKTKSGRKSHTHFVEQGRKVATRFFKLIHKIMVSIQPHAELYIAFSLTNDVLGRVKKKRTKIVGDRLKMISARNAKGRLQSKTTRATKSMTTRATKGMTTRASKSRSSA
jgi:hypothetical protein